MLSKGKVHLQQETGHEKSPGQAAPLILPSSNCLSPPDFWHALEPHLTQGSHDFEKDSERTETAHHLDDAVQHTQPEQDECPN